MVHVSIRQYLLMKYTFFLFLWLSGSLVSRAQSGSYVQEVTARLENSKKSTLQMAQAMPENQYDYKPAADEMSFRAQLLHISQNVNWLTSTHLTTQPSPIVAGSLKDAGQSKAAVEQLIAQAFDYAIESVRAFDAARLEEKVTFFAGPLSKRQIMNLLNDHQSHHRGQLVVYLRMNGVKPPAYVGW